MLGMSTTSDALTTGMKEIAEALGGGIKENSLVLVEGEAKAGKSVMSQYIAYGILCSKASAVCMYAMESVVENMLLQMESLSLDVRKDFVTDRFRVYSITVNDIIENIRKAYSPIIDHITGLPARFKLVVVDSITPLLMRANPTVKVQFLHTFKEMCAAQKRSILLSADTSLFEGKTLARAHAISDYYLRLKTQDSIIERGQVDTRNIKILDVTKLNGADRWGQDCIKFEIKPNVGLQILPLVRIKL